MNVKYIVRHSAQTAAPKRGPRVAPRWRIALALVLGGEICWAYILWRRTAGQREDAVTAGAVTAVMPSSFRLTGENEAAPYAWKQTTTALPTISFSAVSSPTREWRRGEKRAASTRAVERSVFGAPADVPQTPELLDLSENSVGQFEASPAMPEMDNLPEHPAVARLTQNTELSAGARSGGIWLALSSWGTQGFQFLISIVMAHLLLPSQFGETALVYAISGFAYIFTDLGLSAAVIHAEKVTDDLLDTAFWLNALSGFALTLIVSAAAFPIAALYGNARLTGLFLVTSLSFTLSLGSIHLALLERTFRFRRIAILESLASVAGSISMPLLVWAGFGIYSVVLGPLLTTVLATTFLWSNVPWRPHLGFSASSMRQIWSFSKGLVGFNTVNYWARNLDNVLLAAFVSKTQLGDYNRSYNLMLIPVGQVNTVLMRGLYPALARMQDDPPRLGRAWIRAITATSGAVVLPLTLTLSATAPALVRTLYGSHWDGMIPSLELLCLAAVPQMIGASCGAPYRAVNRASFMFKIGMVSTACTIVAIVVGIHWGTVGVAAALLVASCVTLPIVVTPLARMLHLSPRQVAEPIAKSWGPCVFLLAAELAVRFSVGNQLAPAYVLLLQLNAGGGVFLMIMWRSQLQVAKEFRQTLHSVVGSRLRLAASAG